MVSLRIIVLHMLLLGWERFFEVVHVGVIVLSALTRLDWSILYTLQWELFYHVHTSEGSSAGVCVCVVVVENQLHLLKYNRGLRRNYRLCSAIFNWWTKGRVCMCWCRVLCSILRDHPTRGVHSRVYARGYGNFLQLTSLPCLVLENGDLISVLVLYEPTTLQCCDQYLQYIVLYS